MVSKPNKWSYMTLMPCADRHQSIDLSNLKCLNSTVPLIKRGKFKSDPRGHVQLVFVI